ncbi:MAG: energy-coupling factor ABC transporter permease, partial [Armatimonadetes bacterium]|nr:energy-coupling factor ABC transporter permease [Armatimonadota bacterium]
MPWRCQARFGASLPIMHLPDGYLDARVWLPLTICSAAVVGPCLASTQRQESPAHLPRLGMTAAYLFAAQMVNLPVLPGVSGHLLGAALAAILVGPVAATVVMACVFLVQAFFFQDGGVTTLGANLFNMGIAGVWGGYAVYRACGGPARLALSAGLAAWAAVMLGALLTGSELALSGVGRPAVLLFLLMGTHAAIGVGEAVLTVGALALLRRARPDLLPGVRGGKGWLPVAGLVGLVLLAPLASPLPDGLEYAAEHLGFVSRATSGLLPALAPDYALPGVRAGWWGTLGAAFLGV